MGKKILYSCDTGIDDALAIAYLLAQKECEVVGITVSYGMGHIGNVYRNTMAVLKLFGREDIPVVTDVRGLGACWDQAVLRIIPGQSPGKPRISSLA